MDAKQLQHFKEVLLNKRQEDEELLKQDHRFETTELSSIDTTHPGYNAIDLVIQTTEMAIDDFR